MNPTQRPMAHFPGTILRHRNIPRSKVSLVSPQKNRVAPQIWSGKDKSWTSKQWELVKVHLIVLRRQETS